MSQHSGAGHMETGKEYSSVSGLRKWGKEGSSRMDVPEVPKVGGVQRDMVGMCHHQLSASALEAGPASFHFAPIQLMEQTPSELYLAVAHIAGTPRLFGKAQRLAELLLVKAQVKMLLAPYPQLAAEFCKVCFSNSSFSINAPFCAYSLWACCHGA